VGGGFHGGGTIGGGFRGGGMVGGGFRGGMVGNGFHGGFVNRGFRVGFRNGFRTGFRSPFFYGYPFYGGFYGGYDDSYYDSSYGYSPYPYTVGSYNPSPNVIVVYGQPPAPEPAPAPVYTNVAPPSGRSYDEYGQEVNPAAKTPGSPIYLVAMKDHSIIAAASYWVNGKMLHYVTLQHQEKQVPLDQVDRAFSQQLNRERRVEFLLPAE
jgi:hypothetical protein